MPDFSQSQNPTQLKQNLSQGDFQRLMLEKIREYQGLDPSSVQATNVTPRELLSSPDNRLAVGLQLLQANPEQGLIQQLGTGIAQGVQGINARRRERVEQERLGIKERKESLLKEISALGETSKLSPAGPKLAALSVEDVNVDIPKPGGGFNSVVVQRTNQGQYLGTDGRPITLPEGTRISQTGRTPQDLESLGLTKPETGKAQARVLRAQEKLRILSDVANTDLTKFLSTKGRATSKIGTILDFASGLGGESTAKIIENFSDVNPIEFAAESRVLFEDLENFFNIHRKDITGAQAAYQELQQLRKSVLNGELPPAQAMASLANLVKRVNLSIESDVQALKEGVSPDASTPVTGTGGSKQQTIKNIKALLNEG